MKKLLWELLLEYLRVAAKIQLWKIGPEHVVGITGSAGKSSCREAVYVILKDRFKVKAGKKSLNTEVGLPTDILGFEDFSWKVPVFALFKLLFDWKKFDVYIAEMGVDKPGDMDYLLSIVKPDIAVLLNVYPVHTFNFPGGVEQIKEEKEKIFRFAKVKISYPDFDDVKPFLINKLGFLFTQDYGQTFAVAAAVGKALGISLDEAKKNLEKNLVLPPGRMSVFGGINGGTIIDSSYNSSRVPAVSALKALKNFKGKRKIAVLGDMRELGELAKGEHEVVAEEAIRDADVVFTFGPLSEDFFPDIKKIHKFRKMAELISAVKEEIKPGDVVLVKGSQNTIMLETLVERLLADPRDVSKLCRRGEFWERKRRNILIRS